MNFAEFKNQFSLCLDPQQEQAVQAVEKEDHSAV